MKSIVLCQFLRRETRRKRPEIMLGSLGHRTTHIDPAGSICTNSRKQTTAWILNSPFFFLSLPSSFWACDTRTCYCSQSFCFLLIYSFGYLRFSWFYFRFVTLYNIGSTLLCNVKTTLFNPRVCCNPLFFVWLSFSSSFSVIVWFDSVALRFDPPVYSPPTYTLTSYMVLNLILIRRLYIWLNFAMLLLWLSIRLFSNHPPIWICRLC